MNEQQLEKHCLAYFQDKEWDILYGPDIVPEGKNPLRKSYQSVLLEPFFRASFDEINTHLPNTCFEQILMKLIQANNSDLITKNRTFHSFLLEGVPVEYQKDDEHIHDHAFLVDFEKINNNRFTVVNQFSVTGAYHSKRPDIVCFVNGIPLAILELKKTTNKNTNTWDSFNQLQSYKNDIPDLFIFNEALVISDGSTARIGSLTSNEENFVSWRAPKKKNYKSIKENDKSICESQLEILIHGFFDRELFLDYIRSFIIFETDCEHILKKMAAYHQVHAVREAVKATLQASIGQGNKKAGVVWHAQGSGKSISMCCYAGKLLQQTAMNNPTLVVVTNRNDINRHLFKVFSTAKDLLKQEPVQAHNREDLRRLLAEREAGGIIFTTVQKFALLNNEKKHPLLNARHNIVIISTKAHQGQYTLKFGHVKHMRDALKNATFIGFTNTPISQRDKDTQATFSEYVSVYDIQDAINDGAAVPIYYESRIAKTDINHEKINALSEQIEENMKNKESSAGQRKTKKEWNSLEKLVGATPRIKRIASDLVAHFEERTQIIDGKAMIVAMSRNICVKLYDEIIAIRPEWHSSDTEKGVIKIIVTGVPLENPSLQPHLYTEKIRKKLEKRFKNPTDPLKLVIVRDMWLASFDVPCCHTMYIDKPMKPHTLMQAVIRVNRIFKDKQGGLVVDYIGIADELKQAFKTYTDTQKKIEPAFYPENSFALLVESLEHIRAIFARSPEAEGFDISNFTTHAPELLAPATNHILTLKDGKERFLDLALAANNVYSLCNTLDEDKSLHKEIAFYSAIKKILSKFTCVNSKYIQKDSTLKYIQDNTIVVDDVADMFNLCGLAKPNISLSCEDFFKKIQQIPYKNLAVELLEKLLKDSIAAKTFTNLVLGTKYTDRLEKILITYHNHPTKVAETIEELISISRDFQTDLAREESLGLNSDELAFYDVLANNKDAVLELSNATLRKIAIELADKLKQSITVDWQVRDNIKARLRILVRRILQRYKYPLDNPENMLDTPNVTSLILKQAEYLSDNWNLE